MKMYFKKERDRDFVKAYEHVMRSYGKDAPYTSRREIVARTLIGGAPKFYITYEMAHRNVSLILRNKSVPCNNPIKREMYNDIARLTLDFMNAHKRQGIGFNEALITVLSTLPAPRFYMNETSANSLICKLQRSRQKQRIDSPMQITDQNEK